MYYCSCLFSQLRIRNTTASTRLLFCCHNHQNFKLLSMKLNINSILLLITMALISQAKSDLIPSEKQALLDFASSIPHGKKLNWSPNTPVCNTWYGVTCTPDATHVFALRLPGLRLIGQIPNNTIGKLQALNTLSLRSNKLSGNLPTEITTLPSLHYLYLQHNEFSGLIPDSISQQLVTLDISFNFFSGKIPPTVQNSTRLIVLQLQQNSLTGPIPNIRSRRLLHFNVSYNHLSGSIPSSLKHFSNSSFIGNLLLCGPPFKPCSGPLPSPPSPSSPPPPPPVFPAPFVSTPPPPKAAEKSGSVRVLPLWSVIVIAAVVTL